MLLFSKLWDVPLCVYVGLSYQLVPVVLQVSVALKESVLGQLTADGNDLSFLHTIYLLIHTYTKLRG